MNCDKCGEKISENAQFCGKCGAQVSAEKLVIGNTYTIIEKIGEGSGGTVYKAYHNRLQQTVVLKQVKEQVKSRFMNRKEVDILKNLRHASLPRVMDFFEWNDEIYTAMDFIPGESFQQLLTGQRSYGPAELAGWTMQICSALRYLHKQNIIHGDIKPDNIMLTPEGNVCLIDFNISLFLDHNVVTGYTAGYGAPEQCVAAQTSQEKRPIIDSRADIYSTGATLYHMVTGVKLVNNPEDFSFDTLERAVDTPFAQVIQKAVQVNPADRYQDAFDMYMDLQKISKGFDMSATQILLQEIPKTNETNVEQPATPIFPVDPETSTTLNETSFGSDTMIDDGEDPVFEKPKRKSLAAMSSGQKKKRRMIFIIAGAVILLLAFLLCLWILGGSGEDTEPTETTEETTAVQDTQPATSGYTTMQPTRTEPTTSQLTSQPTTKPTSPSTTKETPPPTTREKPKPTTSPVDDD